MRVLLTNPPWLRPGWYGVRAGSRWPHMERAESPYMPFPFLLGYAAAVLEADGHEVVAIDACAERMDRDEFVDRVEAASPDVIFAEISTPSFHGDLRTMEAIRERGFDGKMLIGGLHKPLFDGSFLSDDGIIDGTCIGEYELTLRDLLRQNLKPKAPIPGLIWRTDAGVLDGGRKPSQESLDDFPYPARHLFPMDRYHDLPGGIPSPSVQLWASRGCSFTCSFCAWPQILYGDNAYRVRDPGLVADEMFALRDQGYESIYFDDDTFNLGKRRTEAIATAFEERGVDMPWAFMGRADTCDPRTYERLAKTGLQAVKYGVESADTARLKQIGKNLDIQRVRDTMRQVKDLGIKVHLTFMFGLPGETYETMQRTLELAYELDPDSAQFTVATPFPGSRLHKELKESGRLEGLEFEDLDGYRTGIVSTDALEAEQIVAFVHGIHRRWETRSRPAGEAPVIPISEIGGSGVSVGILVRPGEGDWMVRALQAVVDQEGPSREIVVVADPADSTLPARAAEVCDWATFLDAEPGESAAAMANRVGPRCTGRWIALLHGGVVPRAGWLQSVIDAGREFPDAGAFAVPLHGGTVVSSALSMARWGRVLPAKDSAGEVFGVRSAAGVFSRALLEDAGGFDPSLPAELADADVALRGLLLGYRSRGVASPGADAGPELALLSEDDETEDADAVRAWARGRLRLALKSIPREAWREAGPALALELLADLVRAGRDRRHPGALLAGFVDGVRDSQQSLADRKTALGRRRVGEGFVRDAFEQSEQEMAHCAWQRRLGTIVS